MVDPPVWTAEQLDADRKIAISNFREERLDEPLAVYHDAFDRCKLSFEKLLSTTSDLSELENSALTCFSDPELLEAIRYLAGPPISEDDLKVLADAPTLSKEQLRKHPEYLASLIHTIRSVIDNRRFAWVIANRPPTLIERESAITASAALLATSSIQTMRRTTSKQRQEAHVRQCLLDVGLREVKRRAIPNVMLAPTAGEFCGESLLGISRSDAKSDKGRLADIVLRLWDHRLMPIECKVSNSFLNSLKRLNNDAAVKAQTWRRDFGVHQVVPTTVLSGVYDLNNLLDAQTRGLTIFWAHDLEPLTEFLKSTDNSQLKLTG